MKKKYLIIPGWIKSAADGEMHFIRAGQLAELYRVDLNDCHIIHNEASARGIRYEDYILLRPRFDGNYLLPE